MNCHSWSDCIVWKGGKLCFQKWRNLSCFDCGGGGGGEYPVEPQYHCGDLHAGWILWISLANACYLHWYKGMLKHLDFYMFILYTFFYVIYDIVNLNASTRWLDSLNKSGLYMLSTLVQATLFSFLKCIFQLDTKSLI